MQMMVHVCLLRAVWMKMLVILMMALEDDGSCEYAEALSYVSSQTTT